jgi:hypothetical protein
MASQHVWPGGAVWLDSNQEQQAYTHSKATVDGCWHTEEVAELGCTAGHGLEYLSSIRACL